MSESAHLQAIRAITSDLTQLEIRSDIKVLRERTAALAVLVILTLVVAIATFLIVLKAPPAHTAVSLPVLTPAPTATPIQVITTYIDLNTIGRYTTVQATPPTATVPPAFVTWLNGCCGCSCPPKK